jgi:hypothetical protein
MNGTLQVRVDLGVAAEVPGGGTYIGLKSCVWVKPRFMRLPKSYVEMAPEGSVGS